MRTDRIDPEFIDSFPDVLEPGQLYISMKYATTAHLCASGCGNVVVLPLSPAEWKMYFDGEAISLTPSVGNWEYPCHAHYWIRGNKIHWAGAWTKKEIESGRDNDQRDLDRYFARSEDYVPFDDVVTPRRSVWKWLTKSFLRR